MTAKELLITCRREKKELLILAERREQLATSLLPKAMRIKPVSVQESAEQDPISPMERPAFPPAFSWRSGSSCAGP